MIFTLNAPTLTAPLTNPEYTDANWPSIMQAAELLMTRVRSAVVVRLLASVALTWKL